MLEKNKVRYPDMTELRNTTLKVIREMVENFEKSNRDNACYRPAWFSGAPSGAKDSRPLKESHSPAAGKSLIPGPRPRSTFGGEKNKVSGKENLLKNSIDDKPLSSVFSYRKKDVRERDDRPMSAVFSYKKKLSVQ